MSYPQHESVEAAKAQDAQTREDRIAVSTAASFTPVQKARAELGLVFNTWQAAAIENLVRTILAEENGQ